MFSLVGQLPWEVRVTVSYPSGREVEIETDTFYSYDMHPIYVEEDIEISHGSLGMNSLES